MTLTDSPGNKKAFTQRLMHWHHYENKRSLPWKGETDPYKIWLSEIILQQTRAEQGLPYYQKFVAAYPTVQDLAAAPDDAAFKLWEGLGYYARCRNMLATARLVAGGHGGTFPQTYIGLLGLKGIGPYTAAAISSFAFGLPHAAVDGNVYRVLARYFGIAAPTDGAAGKKLFQALADEVLDRTDPGGFNQAMMDHGATICTPASPKCGECPVGGGCIARRDKLVEILPVRAKKAAVRPRYFHYILIRHKSQLWIQQRTAKDVWRGLYEPFLVEAGMSLDRKAVEAQERVVALGLHAALEYEGELTQRLTHQLIRARFFSAEIPATPKLPDDGLWVELSALNDYAFPRSLITFFKEKGYF